MLRHLAILFLRLLGAMMLAIYKFALYVCFLPWMCCTAVLIDLGMGDAEYYAAEAAYFDALAADTA
jgi:hypothetical protein